MANHSSGFPNVRQLLAPFVICLPTVPSVSNSPIGITTLANLVRARDELTLFCHLYNVFLMFIIYFFVLNSNPMSARFNLKVKHDVSRNEARNRCNTSFQCDFDFGKHDFSRNEARNKCNTSFQCDFGQSISENILIIEIYLVFSI